MVLRKNASLHEQSNVRYIEGLVSFGGVKLNVCSFATDGVLIDTGAHVLLEEFKSFFNEANIDKAVITHAHEDHTGGAAFLQKEYGLPIYTNEIIVEKCANQADYPFYRQLFWGRRRPFQANPIGKTFSSRNAAWQVIETPGHATDHLSFLNEETGQLFSGDLYVQPKTKVILRGESIPTIINSIEKVLTYDFKEMFCCHAGYVKEGRHALTQKLNYLKELEGQVLSLQKQGYNEKEIQGIIFKKKYPITLFSFGETDSIHIIRSILN